MDQVGLVIAYFIVRSFITVAFLKSQTPFSLHYHKLNNEYRKSNSGKFCEKPFSMKTTKGKLRYLLNLQS